MQKERDESMKREIRKTITGTEFWDSESKTILFVPSGEEPDFEVASIESVNTEGESKDDSNVNIEDIESFEFSTMNVPQLKAYAEENGIEIPKGATKRSDIIKLLS